LEELLLAALELELDCLLVLEGILSSERSDAVRLDLWREWGRLMVIGMEKRPSQLEAMKRVL
jgi:hypothetical protein